MIICTSAASSALGASSSIASHSGVGSEHYTEHLFKFFLLTAVTDFFYIKIIVVSQLLKFSMKKAD